jgi:hypothetical protein
MEPLLLATSCFPPVAYMAELVHAGAAEFEIHETYTKQTCRNHYVIYGPNGRQVLSIPVKKPDGNRTKTRDILIDHDKPWQKLHWRSIETAYNNSPFFLYYRDPVEMLFRDKTNSLPAYNLFILEEIMQLLNLGQNPHLSLTNEFHPAGKESKKELLVSKRHAPSLPRYFQPFSPKHGFLSNLSILDCLFNLGPETSSYLTGINRDFSK